MFYAYDGLGSVAALSNHQGKLKTQYQYDAFGEVLARDLSDNPYAFTGQRLDPESNLYHFHFRQYDAEVGAWTTADPIGVLGGVNLYQYVQNNPVNLWDWLGLRAPVESDRLPEEFRPGSLYDRDIDMIDFRPGGCEDVRGSMTSDPEKYGEYDSIRKVMTGKYDLIRQEMTDAGNYNYGYAGAKNGWEYETLQHIADFVQWGFGFGKQGCFACVPKDNPVDAQNILEGYNDYHDWSSPNDSGYGKGGDVSGWGTDNGGWVGL